MVYHHVAVPNRESFQVLQVFAQDEFGSRSEFEERATAYHFANALAILKACGEQETAQEMFQVWDRTSSVGPCGFCGSWHLMAYHSVAH